jgi:ribonuclease E
MEAVEASEPVVEPGSSPMVERPIDEEAPIAQTDAVEVAQPKRRRARKKAAAEAEIAVSETVPPEAPATEIAEEAAPKAKRPRKRKASAEETSAAASEAVQVPAANNDTADAEESAEPKRGGWWQRTIANRL